MTDPELEARIDKEIGQLKKSDIPRISVPKFLINGREPEGSRNLENDIKIIETELKQ